MISRCLPNINWVRAVLCPAVVFIATGMDRGYQTDFWHHLARGREIARVGHAGASVETFAFTVAGKPVRDANWLTQLAYFRLFELGGMPLVQTANSLVLALAAALLVAVCRRRGCSVAVAAGVGVFAFAGIWQTLLIRPQSLSLLLFVVLYFVLIEAEHRRRLLMIPPVLMALWANLHGGFPIGLFLIAAFLAATAAERWSIPLRRRWFVTVARDDGDGGIAVPTVRPEERAGDGTPPVIDFARAFGFRKGRFTDPALAIRAGTGMLPGLLLCLLASVAATLVNPYGARVYQYVLSLSSLAAGRQVEEWLPPSIGLWVGRAWAASVLVLIVLLALAPRRPRARDLFVALCFLPLACASVRMVPWWLLAVAPVLAMTLGRSFAAAAAAKRQKDASDDACLAAAGGSARASALGYTDYLRAVAPTAMFALVMVGVTLSVPGMERFNPVFGRLRPAARPEADLQVVLGGLAEPRAGVASRVFTRLEWGEYLDWAAHPHCRVFMDGRIEIYPDSVWRQYHAVTSARDDWQAILDARRVDYLLLDAGFHGELLPRVDASRRWQRLHAAGPAILYGRRNDGLAATDIQAAP